MSFMSCVVCLQSVSTAHLADEWRKEGDDTHLRAWRSRESRGGNCTGILRTRRLRRAGKPARPVRDPDDAFRTLLKDCFGSRLPR